MSCMCTRSTCTINRTTIQVRTVIHVQRVRVHCNFDDMYYNVLTAYSTEYSTFIHVATHACTVIL